VHTGVEDGLVIRRELCRHCGPKRRKVAYGVDDIAVADTSVSGASNIHWGRINSLSPVVVRINDGVRAGGCDKLHRLGLISTDCIQGGS
jgi:hypothetical protein